MISKRLNKIVDFIDEGHDVADIGSDHGLVLLLLSKKGFKANVLGVENKPGPYENLSKTVKTINKPNFQCILGNGLENLTENYKTVILAGMGYSTIKSIIEANLDKIDFINTFIVDSHTNQDEIRRFFVNLGFNIVKEEIVYEDSIFYDLEKFQKSNVKKSYTDKELKYGPINLDKKTEEFKLKYNSKLLKYKEIIDKINNEKRITELKREIKEIEDILYEN